MNLGENDFFVVLACIVFFVIAHLQGRESCKSKKRDNVMAQMPLDGEILSVKSKKTLPE